MKIVLVPMLASALIFVAVLLLTSLTTLELERASLIDLSSSPIFLFFALNFITLAILLGGPSLTDHEVERRFSSTFNEEVRTVDAGEDENEVHVSFALNEEVSVDDADDEGNEIYIDDGEDEDDGHSNDGSTSNGYEEDDDDESGSDGEIGWYNDEDGDEASEKHEDGDSNLEKRSEDFIARVIKGWWEERMKED